LEYGWVLVQNPAMPRAWRLGCGFAAVFASVSAFARPAEAQTQRYHHGLYVRVAGGASYFSDTVESDPLPLFGTVEGTLKGAAFSTQVGVGGSIAPGVVLGGMLLFNHMPSPSATSAESHGPLGTTPIADIDFDPTTFTVVGPFVDYYFDPASGLHAQAALGYGVLSLGQGSDRGTGNRRVQDQSGSGFAAMIGGGYEWWVSSSWGVGVLGQLMFGLGSGEDSAGYTWRHRVLVPGLFVSATKN
jgi:hypothetical protein